MNLVRCIPLLAIAVLTAASRVEAAPTLTVTQITRAGQSVASTPDVTLRALDGHVLRQGVRKGEALPNDVRVEVPTHESVVITSPGGSRATLEPGAIDTFHYTGSVESVAPSVGKTNFYDPLDFYHVSGPRFNALAKGTVYSIELNPNSVTITCTGGSVKMTKVGITAAGSGESGQPTSARAYIERVDTIAAARRRSITYNLGRESAANIASQVQADRSAAATRDTDAEVNLGVRYRDGRGVAQDYSQALRYFRLAADQGNAFAEDNIGFMYDYGQGVPQDYAQALHWYQLAAAQGLADALNNLGYAYQYGQGVVQDYATALRYFQLSANPGDAEGEAHLGVMYANGLGVRRNDVTALRYFQLSAAQGDASGEGDLGWMYDPRRKGQGVAQDYATALHYYQLSAQQILNAGLYCECASAPSAQGLTVVKLIPVGHDPQRAAITPDGREVYVTNADSDSVSVIDTRSLTVTNTLQVGNKPGDQPGAIVVSHDGRHVYVANNGGYVSIIDTGTKKMETISTGSSAVSDLALTPDDRRLFLAMIWSGLQVIDLSTSAVVQVSEIYCPEGLAIPADGKRLYVNYQCGGPSGSAGQAAQSTLYAGHDAVAIFDLDPNKPCSLGDSAGCVYGGAIQGFPNVGGPLALSPDGQQLWLNGNDACSQPAYDHVGCPMVPGAVVDVIDTSTNRLLKTITFNPAEGNGPISFLPHGGSVIIGGGLLLKVMDWRHIAFRQPLPISSSGLAAFSADGSRAFLPVGDKNVVAVVKVI
jgi:YVTN family beta-propeller protein